MLTECSRIPAQLVHEATMWPGTVAFRPATSSLVLRARIVGGVDQRGRPLRGVAIIERWFPNGSDSGLGQRPAEDSHNA